MNFVTVHYVYEAIPINFYIHYTLDSVACVFSSLAMSFPSLFPSIHFRSIFFLFLFKSPIVFLHSIMDIICASMIWTRRSEKKKNLQPTIITTSCGFCCCLLLAVCAVLSCCYVLLIHCSNYWYPSKALVSLCRFIDLASVLQQQQSRQSVASRARPKKEREKKFSFICVSKKFFYIQIM